MGLRRATPARQPSSALSPLFVAPRQGMQALADRLIDRLGRSALRSSRPRRRCCARIEGGSCRTRRRAVRRSCIGRTGAGRFLVARGSSRRVGGPTAGGHGVRLGGGHHAGVRRHGVRRSGTAKCPFRGSQGFWRRGEEAERDKRHPGGPRERDGNDSVFLRFPQMATLGRSGNDRRAGLAGRANEQYWARLDDEGLVERSCRELETVVVGRPGAGGGPGLPPPLAWRVSRWPGSMPQYTVGHLDRVASTRAMLARYAPTVSLAGASYNGVGVPACIGSGRRAAREVLSAVESLGLPTS